MATTSGGSEQQTSAIIWAAIEAANAAWTAPGPTDAAAVRALFAENVVLVAPGLAAVVEGRDRVVASVVDFANAATIEAFDVLEHRVDVAGATAVATYSFRIRYRLAGSSTVNDERGQEVLVFQRGDDEDGELAWRAVWRTQLALPPATEPTPEEQVV